MAADLASEFPYGAGVKLLEGERVHKEFESRSDAHTHTHKTPYNLSTHTFEEKEAIFTFMDAAMMAALPPHETQVFGHNFEVTAIST